MLFNQSNCNFSSDEEERSEADTLRFFGKILLCRLFCPALVYRSDMLLGGSSNAQQRRSTSLTSIKRSSSNSSSTLSFYSGQSKDSVITPCWQDRLVQRGTLPNRLAMLCAWQLFACGLTWLAWLYMRVEVGAEPARALVALTGLFVVLAVGLCRRRRRGNERLRCVALLVIPFMASSRGRSLLLMHCVSLSAEHVLANTLRNAEAVESAYACTRRSAQAHWARLAQSSDAAVQARQRLVALRRVAERARARVRAAKRVLQRSAAYARRARQSLGRAFNICEKAYRDQRFICEDTLNPLNYTEERPFAANELVTC